MVRFNELVTELSVDVEDKTVRALDTFHKRIVDISSGLQNLGHALTGQKSFSEILFGSASDSQRMINTANTLKMTLKDVQEWSHAAESVGISSEQVLSDISHMQNVIGMNREQILKFADEFKRTSLYGRQALMQFYEFGDSTATLFARGRKPIEEFFKAADKTIVSEENIHKLDAVETKLNDLTRSMSNMMKTSVAEYADTINIWLRNVQKFLEDGERVEKVLKNIKIGLMMLAGVEILNVFAALLNNLNILWIAFKRILQIIAVLDTTFVGSILRWGGYLTALYGAIKGIVAALIAWEEWGYQDKLKKAGGPMSVEGQALVKKHQENTAYLQSMTSGIEKFDALFSKGYEGMIGMFDGKEDLSDLKTSLQSIDQNTKPLKRETPGMSVAPWATGYNGNTSNNVTNNIENTIYTSAPISEVIDAVQSTDEYGDLAIYEID